MNIGHILSTERNTLYHRNLSAVQTLQPWNCWKKPRIELLRQGDSPQQHEEAGKSHPEKLRNPRKKCRILLAETGGIERHTPRKEPFRKEGFFSGCVPFGRRLHLRETAVRFALFEGESSGPERHILYPLEVTNP